MWRLLTLTAGRQIVEMASGHGRRTDAFSNIKRKGNQAGKARWRRVAKTARVFMGKLEVKGTEKGRESEWLTLILGGSTLRMERRVRGNLGRRKGCYYFGQETSRQNWCKWGDFVEAAISGTTATQYQRAAKTKSLTNSLVVMKSVETSRGHAIQYW